MKITEIQKPSDRKLFEEFSQGNDSGFSAKDLVEIAKADMQDKWLTPVTYEQYIAEDEADYQAWLAEQEQNS